MSEKAEKELAKMLYQDIKADQKDMHFIDSLFLKFSESDFIETKLKNNLTRTDDLIDDSQSRPSTILFYNLTKLILEGKLIVKI
tara:strand:+ start:1741 stop:1992 length:252 start_codon:yes stop_codon:yes gene_type:complete